MDKDAAAHVIRRFNEVTDSLFSRMRRENPRAYDAVGAHRLHVEISRERIGDRFEGGRWQDGVAGTLVDIPMAARAASVARAYALSGPFHSSDADTATLSTRGEVRTYAIGSEREWRRLFRDIYEDSLQSLRELIA